jgi:hypothetical protein
MKKRLIKLTAAILCVALISGCGSGRRNAAPEPDPAATADPVTVCEIAEYFPLLEGALYKYTGIGDDELNQEMFTLFANDTGAQILTSTPSYEVTDVFRIEDGALKVIYNDLNYFYDNLLGTKDVRHMTILQEPFELGRAWGFNPDGAIAEITSLNAPVSTPYGEFEALEVTIRHHDDYIQRDYYARGVGLIQISYVIYGVDKTMKLTEITRDASKTVEVDICKVNVTLDRLEWERRPFTLSGNMDMAEYWNALLKAPLPIDYQPLLPGDSRILSLSVYWNEVLLTVDLSEDYVRSVGAGAGIESAALQALANTLGNFYNVTRVEILLDGSGYESGHILMDEGEYWDVEPPAPPRGGG